MASRRDDIDALEQQLSIIQQSTKTLWRGAIPAHEWLRNHSSIYYKWHLMPYSSQFHWLSAFGVLALAIVQVAVFLAPFSSPNFSLAAPATWTQSSQADFTAGTHTGTTVTNTNGGEVTVAGSVFTHSRTITVDNSSGTNQTDYQAKITLNSSNFDFSSTQADGDDIRFADQNGVPLSHWTETWDAGSQTATVWVKLPTLDGASTRTITMYYGNANVASASSGANVFPTFDDFTDLSGWTTAGTSVSVSNGIAILDNNGGTSPEIKHTYNQGGEYIVEAKYRRPSVYRNRLNVSKADGTVTGYDHGDFSPSIYWNGFTGTTLSSDTWYIVRWEITNDNYTWKFFNYADGTEVFSRSHGSAISDLNTISFSGSESTNSDLNLDWVRIRKYQSTEPIVTVNSKQIGSAPNTTLAGWSHRAPITVTNNTAGELINYQVAVEFDSKAAVDAGTLQASGNDLRFTAGNGTTVLDHWVESGMNSRSTKVWVKVPSIPASGSVTIYLYHGNSGASSVSSADTTFVRTISNLDGAWTFDEASGTVADSSGNNNTGTPTGTSVITGKFGNARSFNGSTDKIVIANESNFDYERNQPFSLETWVKRTGDGTDDFVMAKYDGSGVGYGMYINGSAHHASGFLQNGSNYLYMKGGSQMNGDTWKHLVFTYDGSGTQGGFRLYINGQPETMAVDQSGGTINSMSILNDASLVIGSREGAPVPFVGSLDEPRVYSKELSAAEVADLASNYGYATTASANTLLVRQRTTTEPTVAFSSASTTAYSAGTFISQAYDTGQFSDFATVTGSGSRPGSSTMGLQIRTADTEVGLSSATWYGPTSVSDYYTQANATINSIHDGDRWVQFRVVLTPAGADIPILTDVALSYDAGDKTISTNTAWSDSSYTLRNLTIDSGAVLTVAGGTTISITGDLTIDDAGGTSKILCQGSNTNAASGGQGCTITVSGDTTVDANSLIDADGQGYTGGPVGDTSGKGPGAGGPGGGAGHGNAGGAHSSGNNAGVAYGTEAAPIDLGSGGGGSRFSAGGAGGGAIRLIVSGTLTLNGAITADGTSAGYLDAGGGSGGSVYVTAGTLAGTGSFTATGGNGSRYGGGGAGGRIVVEYTTNDAFNLNTGAIVTGGSGANSGTKGDAFYDANNDLVITSYMSFNTGSSLSYGDITVQNGASLILGGNTDVTASGDLTLDDAGGATTMICLGSNTSSDSGGAGCTLTVSGSVVVDASSSINADGKGYAGGSVGDTAGHGPGAGGGGGGGGHGGVGGNDSGGADGGASYGSSVQPTDLGSGGGGSGFSAGGAGGGAVRLNITGALTLNGTITADGSAAAAFDAGGGSGGSIFITTGTIAGSGTITATGGNGNRYGGGGAGGRIVVEYTTNDAFNFDTGITTAGGSGANAGGTGTSFTIANGQLVISENFNIDAGTALNRYNNLTIQGGATLTVGGGSSIVVTDTFTVTGNSNVVFQGSNTNGLVEGVWQGTGSTVTAANIVIANGSSLSANAQGYTAGAVGETTGNGPGGGGPGGGAGYGGIGGNDSGGADGGTTYGSSVQPTDLGSGGGGSGFAAGGAGGGAIRLTVSNTLTIDGTITANGTNAAGLDAGGGAGGSVYITTGTIAGSGTITATGGNGNRYGGGGAGGRIAAYYTQGNTLPQNNLVANSGNGANNGANGSIILASLPVVSPQTANDSYFYEAPTISLSISDVDGKNVAPKIEYVNSFGANVCSENLFNGVDAPLNAVRTVEAIVTPSGWSGNGSYATAQGAATATYTIPADTLDPFNGGWCWRVAARPDDGVIDIYSTASTPRKLILDATTVGTTITTIFNAYYQNPQDAPDAISGTVRGDASGQGIDANSLTIAITRASDGKYWDGATWTTTPTYLPTTHLAANAGQEVAWTSNAALPEWVEDVYTVQPRSTNKAGKLTNGTSQGFVVDYTPPAQVDQVIDGASNVDQDFTNVTTEIQGRWSETNDRTAGLERYEYAFGTTPGGSDLVNWNNNSTNVDTAVDGLNLDEGTKYYLSVRALDRAGNITGISTSNGITPDVTPPQKISQVATGSALDQAKTRVNTPDRLTFTWTQTSDNLSGIDSYDYAIGTTPGGTDVVEWTESSVVVSAVTNPTPHGFGIERASAAETVTYSETVTGLALSEGTTYYPSVRPVDIAGNTGPSTTASSGTVLDVTAPTAPTITTPAHNSSITDTTPLFSGTAEALSTITIAIAGQTITTTASAQGSWVIETPIALSHQQYTAIVTATDEAGNISSAAERTFTVAQYDSSAIYDPPAEESVGIIFNPVTGQSTPDDTPTNTNTPSKSAGGSSKDPSTETYQTVPLLPEELNILLVHRGVTRNLSIDGAGEILPGDPLTLLIRPPKNKTITSAEADLGSGATTGTALENGWYSITLPGLATAGNIQLLVTVTYTDATTEQKLFALLVDPFGYIYAKNAQGNEVRLKNSTVTLEQLQGENRWIVWDAARFGQSNPQQTNEQGEYAFVVPQGTYRVVAMHDGYRTIRTEPLTITNEPVNLNIELVPISEAGAAFQSITDGALGLLRQYQEAYGELANHPIARTTQQTAATAAAGTVLAAIFIPSILNLPAFSPIAQALGSLFSLINGFRRRKTWGIVRDKTTGQPIALAAVQVFDAERNKLLETQVSDSHGRYSFLLPAGTYYLRVQHAMYELPTTQSRAYHGQQIDLAYKQLITPELVLTPRQEVLARKGFSWTRLLVIIDKIRLPLLLIGTVFAILLALANPTTTNSIVLAVYGLAWLYEIAEKIRTAKAYGKTFDRKTSHGLDLTIVRLFNEETKKLAATRVTDRDGHYNMLITPGAYRVELQRVHYKPQTDTLKINRHANLNKEYPLDPLPKT